MYINIIKILPNHEGLQKIKKSVYSTINSIKDC